MNNPIRFEFKRFKGLPLIALLFICFMPLIYGGIYLHANWDLYDHIDSVKVAVVNHDEPAAFEGKEINAGAEFEDALKDSATFDWQFLGEDDAGAEQGLANGEYYMVVTVPENFSSNLVSAGTFHPERATITLHRDDANGFIIGTLTGKADDTLSKILDSTVSEAYFRALFTNLDEIKNQLSEAADGSQELDTSLARVADGVSQLNDGVTEIDVDGLTGQIAALNAALGDVDAGASGLIGAAGQLRDAGRGLSGAGASVATGLAGIDNAFAPISHFLNNRLPELADSAVTLADLTADLVGDGDGSIFADAGAHLSATRELLGELRAHPEVASDPEWLAKLDRELAAATDAHAEIGTKLGAQASISAELTTGLDPTLLKASADALNAARGTLSGVSTNLTDAANSLNNGLNATDAQLSELSGALTNLRSTSSDMLAQGPELGQKIVNLVDAVGSLNTAMPQIADGAHELATGLREGADALPTLSEDERATLSQVMSSPVDVQQKVSNDAKYYGRGLAPMFLSIALWVASISTFLVVRTVSGRALVGRASALRAALGGFGAVGTLALTGATLLGVGCWALLGLDPVHPWLFFLLLYMASLAFMALGYCARLAIGSPQTAIFLIALIVQLPACGGTFPIDMLGPVYRTIGAIAPMRYSVDAFRVAISGGNASVYWGSLAILGVILTTSLAVTWWLVHRRRRFRMRDLHPPMVTSSSTSDNAFAVKPR